MDVPHFTHVFRPIATPKIDSSKCGTTWKYLRNSIQHVKLASRCLARWDKLESIHEHTIKLNWLVVWNIFYFPIYWESSSQLTNIFQRGSNHQPDVHIPKYFQTFPNISWKHLVVSWVIGVPLTHPLLGIPFKRLKGTVGKPIKLRLLGGGHLLSEDGAGLDQAA